MNTAQAVAIADGMQRPAYPDEFVEAYQLLVDEGIAWTLQERIGKMAWEMIRAGLITSQSQEGTQA
jgi:hypothetical protein